MGNKRGGLLFGVIVGTLLGVLFAPRKGKELRKQLKNEVAKGGVGTETLKKNFVEMGEDMASTAGEVYSQPEVQKVVKKGKKQVDQWMQVAEGHIEKAEEKVKGLGEKYLDIGDEQLQKVSDKIHHASRKVQGKIHSLRQKFMGDVKFSKKPISKTEKRASSASKKSAPKGASKKRTRRVNIKKK